MLEIKIESRSEAGLAEMLDAPNSAIVQGEFHSKVEIEPFQQGKIRAGNMLMYYMY